MNKKEKKYLNFRLMAIIVFGLVLLLTLAYIFFYSNTKQLSQFSNDIQEETYYISMLSGERMLSEKLATPEIVTVMVDNNPDAWPLSGLDQAKVVYEAPVEGVYTRFMAVFADYQTVDKIGPVRSARPYYLDWLGEYGRGLYMHCGGSPEALSRIKDEGLFDANEFYWGRFYWRDRSRYAPHNLYTSSEKWSALLAEYGARHATTSWYGWKYGDLDKNIFNESALALQLDYDYYDKINWVYDNALDKYLRNRGKYQESIESILADNVIVQYVKMRSLDENDRKEILTTGSGDARVLRNGRMVRANWEKKSGDRTRFYTQDNQEIFLNPGVTWIEIVPKDYSVIITN